MIDPNSLLETASPVSPSASPFTIDLNVAAVNVIPPAPAGPARELLTLIAGTTDEYLLVLDNTAAERFTTCPTAASFYLVHKREAHARNAALTYGGAVHAGLEVFHKGPIWEDNCGNGEEVSFEPAFTDRINHAIHSHFARNPTPPDEYRTPVLACQVLHHYRARCLFPDFQWTILSDDAGLLVERAFEVPLGVIEVNAEVCLPDWDAPRHVSRIHVAWSGRIDVVVHANGSARIADHKTTSISISDNFLQDFTLSNQTLGYCWAGRQLWPELNITGFVLNAIHCKKPSGSSGIMDRGPRGGPPALDLQRAYYDYTPERLEQWHANALLLVSDFIHCLVRDHAAKLSNPRASGFPTHTKWCFGKYGKCAYHDCCVIDDPIVRVRMLQSDAYKTVTWDPAVGQ